MTKYTPKKVVYIGDVPIGYPHPTVVMAEIGTFFNNNIELARQYLNDCAKAGAKVFKTEILHSLDFILEKGKLDHTYRHGKAGEKATTENYYELLSRKVVSLDSYALLLDECKKLGIPFVASCYDREGVDFMHQNGGSAIKIARSNIDNVPLIRHAARTNLPVILDAGGTYLDEVAFAVRLAQSEGDGGVVVNHHTGHNPTPAKGHHFRIMKSYQQALNVPVGFSCHYIGLEMSYIAVAMGASLIEKGVDQDRSRQEQDLVSAANMSELKLYIDKVHECWESLGEVPANFESRNLETRCGIVAKKDLEKGGTLSESDLDFAFPPLGISISRWDEVLGAKLKKGLIKKEPLLWEHLEF